jgi:hypothetical protein
MMAEAFGALIIEMKSNGGESIRKRKGISK